jgi:hypothetical protein
MGKASGMIAIPAKLCSDFILIPGTAIHIALEHIIHFAGIRSGGNGIGRIGQK